jgi:hypothetical protein
LEITFTFDAPDDEMARAKLIGAEVVATACTGLLTALEHVGAKPTMTARFVKSVPARSNSGRKPRLQAAAE